MGPKCSNRNHYITSSLNLWYKEELGHALTLFVPISDQTIWIETEIETRQRFFQSSVVHVNHTLSFLFLADQRFQNTQTSMFGDNNNSVFKDI